MPIIKVAREFLYDDITLPDPDPNMTPQEVISFYSGKYPELAAAGIEEENTNEEGKIVYTIGKAIGTKA